MLIYLVLALGLLVSCKKVIFDGKDKPLPTTPATKTPTAAASDGQNIQDPGENQQTENQQPDNRPTDVPAQGITGTPVPAPTDEPVVPITPTATPTVTPTPGPITAEEAEQLLLRTIGGGYSAEQNGAVETAGSAYYLFTVSDGEQSYSPQIAVDARSKEIFYYYSQDEIAEFANFPPDNLESAGQEDAEPDDGFSSEDAVALLKELTAEDLGLPAGLEEYTILVDEWTTMVFGVECFCVNAYAELENRKQLMGVYFVAIDGSAAYRSDMGDFVLIY